MKKKTLEALHGSIKEWENIVDGDGVDLGTLNCPLCERFSSAICSTPSRKEKCPASIWPASGCVDTPYHDWDLYFVDYPICKREVTSSETKRLAQAELDFLKSLLPNNKQEKSNG